VTIEELLSRGKQAIETGEKSMRAAAEDIAAAQAQGATQRQIASAVGKSAAWVNQLLRWRESGYHDQTPFGPQAKASRQRARVQATEQKEPKPATTSEQAEAAAARARAETAEAEATKAKRAEGEGRRCQGQSRSARGQGTGKDAPCIQSEVRHHSERTRLSPARPAREVAGDAWFSA
jgi:hypothetical protein